jgi:hypothetical protein
MTTYVSDELLASLDHGGSTPPTVSVCSLLSSMGFSFFFQFWDTFGSLS